MKLKNLEKHIKQVELIAERESHYSIYVFKNLEESEYIMCTRVPNWNTPTVNIGMKGFLEYIIVDAGDEYTTPEQEVVKYKYPNCYFINFVNKADEISKEIIL